MTAATQVLLDRLATELEALLESGCNWQLTVHGGRGGHIKLEILRTDDITSPPSPDAPKSKPPIRPAPHTS